VIFAAPLGLVDMTTTLVSDALGPDACAEIAERVRARTLPTAPPPPAAKRKRGRPRKPAEEAAP
jgi:hypothetical protein